MYKRRFVFIILAVVAVTAILASVLSVASKTEADGAVTDADYPVLAAHRGGAGVWPQNTMVAFDNALKADPDLALELDVQALKDGTLVVMHDPKVDSLSANGMTGNVKDMTPAQWKALRIKSPTGGQAAPAATLDDVLNEYGNTDTMLVIELKDAAAADKFVEKLWPHHEQVLIQSFDTAIVSRMVRTGFSTLQLASNSSITLVDGIHSVGIQTLNITPALVTKAHDKGVKVWAWGNEVTRTQFENHDRGLDGYMVNDPTK